MAPWLARWTGPDPGGLRDGTNRFAYARSNPVRFIDPNGQESRLDRLRRLPYQSGISDEQIKHLWSPDWEKGLIDSAVGGYENHLRGLDQAEQDRFKSEGWFHPHGYYQPLFDDHGQPNAHGKEKLSQFRSDLRTSASIQGDDPVRRTREILYQYYREVSGLRQKQELLALAIVSTFAGIVGRPNALALRPRLAAPVDAVGAGAGGGTAAGDAAAGGEVYLATLKNGKTEFGHNAVGVRTAGAAEPTFYDQGAAVPIGGTKDVIRGGFDTEFGPRTAPVPPKYDVLKVPVSSAQADAAAAKAQSMTGQGGPYNLLTNSCTTTCRAVLEAAGLKPPGWARSPSLLSRWFRGIGGAP